MAKIELSVFFKMQQKDDKKEVLKFEIKGDGQEASLPLHQLAGSIIFFEIENCKAGEVPAEFMNIQRDSKKTTMKFAIKGDSQEKAQELYKFAGHNVNISVQPSQMSLEEFYGEDEDQDEDEEHHEGVEYTVDLGGNVDVKETREIPEEEDSDPFDDDDDLE